MFTPKRKSSSQSLLLLLSIKVSTILLLPISSSVAETPSVPSPSDAPLELAILNQPDDTVITSNTINPEGLTTPSLWWQKENSENKLLDNWIAYPANETEPARVDLIVNQQIWSLLDYLERFEFVNRLGNTARKEGYNLRVFNYQQNLLATYTCNFDTTPPLCRIQINAQNRLGVTRSF